MEPATFGIKFKRMGVMNITPNSFSDGGEIPTIERFVQKFNSFGDIDYVDIGAESTAPVNDPVSPEEEWSRLRPYLPYILTIPVPVSIDTYHPETILNVAMMWLKAKNSVPLIWNDVSGKFDEHVKKFLSLSDNFYYIFCHNLSPLRELSGQHLEYISGLSGNNFLNGLCSYFRPFTSPRVIFDPCLGFSKSYEQNWYVLNHFGELQSRVKHDKWLVGFSRKSFLRKKLGLGEISKKNLHLLDEYQLVVLSDLKKQLQTDLIVRTHRPELISS